MEEQNILQELQAVKNWLSHPSVAEKLRAVGMSAMLVTASKYGECEAVGHSSPSGIEAITECIIASAVDTLDEDNCCTYISEIVDFIGEYIDDIDENLEDEEDESEEGVIA